MLLEATLWWNFILLLVLLLALTVVSIVDIKTLSIPLVVVGILAVVGLGSAYIEGSDRLIDSLIGAVAGYFVLRTVSLSFKWLAGKEGLGDGDAYLLAAGGAWVGWQQVSLIVLIASTLTMVIVILKGRAAEHFRMIPFAPGISIGILSVWLLRIYAEWHQQAG